MPCVAWVTGSVENIPRAAVDLSLLVVECAMERALDIVGQRLTRCLCRHICPVE